MSKYSTVSLMLGALPAIGSRTNINSADLHSNFLLTAESVIDSRLIKTYTLPITTFCSCGDTCDVPVLQTLSTDLALYRLLTQRIFTQEKKNESVWPDKFKAAMQLLDDIANGKMSLVTDDGSLVSERTDILNVDIGNADYLPTMTEDDSRFQLDDPDKIDDIRTDRDIFEPHTPQ